MPMHGAARAPARRAGPDGPLAVDERPQPRRRLPAPARALPVWEAVREAPVEEVEEAIRPGGISKVEVGAHPGDPARRSGREEPLSTGCATRRSRGAATTSARCPASAARRRRACCCSPTGCATCRSTRTSRASGRACACCGRGAPFERAARRDARADAARAPSSSCTSTCCATAGAPATRAARRAAPARCGGCARGGWRDAASRWRPQQSRQHGEDEPAWCGPARRRSTRSR